ncbi:hypothetical protein C8C85_1796 [Flavobacterium sp. 103]|nr:hypothetical protein C8C85_1796 [Flavobacterium sp. 103]
MVKTSTNPLILRTNYDSIYLFLRTKKNKHQIHRFTPKITGGNNKIKP